MKNAPSDAALKQSINQPAKAMADPTSREKTFPPQDDSRRLPSMWKSSLLSASRIP